ncbi:MAG: MBL fold metallo-hydrolase, partial [bacterium]|nr:MBL fold metallo-hydrolase [bacterium]
MPEPRPTLSRRELVMLLSALAALPARRLFAEEKIAAKPWGRPEQIGEGIWAVVSTPLAEDDWTTLCNGGLVAGKERTLAVDAYARPAGAAWVGGLARELAGRWPTDVVITHYHGDHVNGLAGFLSPEKPRPRVWITAATLELVRQADAESEAEPDPTRTEMLEQVTILAADEPTELDLGGRKVKIHPRSGHTASDVTVEIDDPSVVFFGDLVWNRMFPNYRDATPTLLSQSVRAAVRKRPTVNVPGHGPLADAA